MTTPAEPSIPAAEFAERQERARRAARDRGLAGLLVVGRGFFDRPGSLAYLTNHFPPFPSGPVDGPIRGGFGYGVLVLPAAGREPVLFADFWRADLVAVKDVRRASDLPRGLAEALRETGLDRAPVGMAGEDLWPLAYHRILQELAPALEVVPADDLVEDLRRTKSEAEVACLRRAAQTATAGLRAALAAVRAGATERDVCAAGIAAAMADGADFVRYLRVHSGPWTEGSARWPQATGRAIAPGEPVWLDVIGARAGYQFDVLRTTVVRPEAGPGTAGADRVRAMLDACASIVDVALARVRAGVTVAELLDAARAAAERAGYAEALSPFLGHGIGLETMERPFLMPGVEATLEPGMVLCVEPALRIPGVGGCSIEEEAVVRPDGVELLTTMERRVWLET